MKTGECLFYTSALKRTIELPCYPDEVSDSISVNWNEQTIIGRTPIVAYNSTSLRNISFTLNLHRDMYHGYQGIYDNSDNGVKIENILKNLRGSAYPDYSAKGLEPPMVIFKFGFMIIKGIIKSINYQWKKPIINERYSVCSVNINMDELIKPDQSEGVGVFSSDNPNANYITINSEVIEL